MKKKDSKEVMFPIIHLCLIVTMVTFVLSYFESFIKSGNIFMQVLFSLIFGIGGIGLYFPFGYVMYKFQKELKKELKQGDKK